MAAARRAYKYLAVVDETPESRTAVHYAGMAAKARGEGAGVVLLMVLEQEQAFQHWLGVEELMKEEAREEAEGIMAALAAELAAKTGIKAAAILREGDKAAQIIALAQEDPSIGALVLAAADSGPPGRLVAALAAGGLTGLRLPVIIIPGDLAHEEIASFA